eukprot:6907143-Alexandrium_andersonii.AAC.1
MDQAWTPTVWPGPTFSQIRGGGARSGSATTSHLAKVSGGPPQPASANCEACGLHSGSHPMCCPPPSRSQGAQRSRAHPSRAARGT